MKNFDVPSIFKSPLISAIKNYRKEQDPRKKDFSPTVLDFGAFRILLARHFGFCYGVENAIEIAYNALAKHPQQHIYFLSEMIHNPEVNADLQNNGISFIFDTYGNQLIAWESLPTNAVVLIPAFGTTLEVAQKLKTIGAIVEVYDTTCPFVKKVWNRAESLGKNDFTVIIHGKPTHEETRATFSHSSAFSHSLIIKNMDEAAILADFITQKRKWQEFDRFFAGRYSAHFQAEKHLQKIGVVNQTTILADDTQEIANFLKETMQHFFGKNDLNLHFADTRDTLCYATNENQNATKALIEQTADAAIIIGGYNSSNTTHLVELCQSVYPTYFIRNATNILAKDKVIHFDISLKTEICNTEFIRNKQNPSIILSSGASCPDALVEETIVRLHALFPDARPIPTVVEAFLGENITPAQNPE